MPANHTMNPTPTEGNTNGASFSHGQVRNKRRVAHISRKTSEMWATRHSLGIEISVRDLRLPLLLLP
jgi:hypothetical protein